MYANFTAEEGTGTGATITLTGAVTGGIPFAKSFAVDDFFGYAIEDSGGTIKVMGYGKLATSTTFTRNDTWNWNGTVIDSSPSSNIALSGGTHTIRCVELAEVRGYYGDKAKSTVFVNHYYVPDNIVQHEGTDTLSNADREWYSDAILLNDTVITTRRLDVTTADAGCTHFRMGIYALDPTTGRPGKLLEDSGDISANVASTGSSGYTLSTPLPLKAGRYFFSVVSDSTTVAFRVSTYNQHWGASGGMDASNNHRAGSMYKNGVTGALASDPSISGALFAFGAVPMGYT